MSNGNGSVAPVCPISRSEFPAAQPGITIPPVPRANDLPSAIAAVNQIVQVLNWMLNPPNNTMIINNMPFPRPRFVEIKRTVTPVRIVSNQDDQVWIDIERISNVQFQDQATKGLLEWNYINKALKAIPKT